MADNDITKSINHELVAGGGEGLTSFFVPTEIDAAFRENQFAIAEMIGVLCDIVREDATKIITKKDGTVIEEPVVTAKEKMAALKMLDAKAKEGMVLGGLIQNDRLEIKRQLADGTTAEYSQDGMRLVTAGSDRLKNTLKLLERASVSNSDQIIDVEVPDSEPGNGPSDGATDGIGHASGSSDSPGGDDECGAGCPGGSGDEFCGTEHGGERADPPPAHRQSEDDDTDTAKGAEDERGAGLPERDGGGGKSQGVGEQSEPDRAGDRGDPGEVGSGPVRRPARIGPPDGGAADAAAQSIADRLDRINRATDQE